MKNSRSVLVHIYQYAMLVHKMFSFRIFRLIMECYIGLPPAFIGTLSSTLRMYPNVHFSSV